MVFRQYYLYDLLLSNAKEHTVRMNAFLLLTPPFPTSMQILDE